jgi:hypothetical protein
MVTAGAGDACFVRSRIRSSLYLSNRVAEIYNSWIRGGRARLDTTLELPRYGLVESD